MNSDCGSPAFDNIDDVLVDKIVAHSVRHTAEALPPNADNVKNNIKPEAARPVHFPVFRIAAILGVIAVTLILVYKIFNRMIRPSAD